MPVPANPGALLAIGAARFDALRAPPHGTGPDELSMLHGLQLIERGLTNLCLSGVSAYIQAAPRPGVIDLKLDLDLAIGTSLRLAQAAMLVRRVA